MLTFRTSRVIQFYGSSVLQSLKPSIIGKFDVFIFAIFDDYKAEPQWEIRGLEFHNLWFHVHCIIQYGSFVSSSVWNVTFCCVHKFELISIIIKK